MHYTIFFTNHGYFSERRFATLNSALVYAKRVCFQADVFRGDILVASWCPIGGTKRYIAE